MRQGWYDTLAIILRYWKAPENNIFRDYADALYGFVTLIILPLLSLAAIWRTNGFTQETGTSGFWSYSYPIMAIGIAGLFDAVARIESKSSKNIKLAVRIVLNSVAIVCAAAFHSCQQVRLKFFPVIILLLCGVVLLREMWDSVTFAICLSKWAARE